MPSKKHEINDLLQIILTHSHFLEHQKRHAVHAAVFDIKALVNETPKDRFMRELDELLEKHYPEKY